MAEEYSILRCEQHRDQLHDHESRLRYLERAWIKVAGAAAVASAVAGALASMFGAYYGVR